MARGQGDKLAEYQAIEAWATGVPQKRWGFTADNIKVRAKLATTFSDHSIPLPQIFVFKVANEIQLETDLTFVRQ